MKDRAVPVAFCLSLSLTACTVGPDYQPTTIALPDRWQTPPVADATVATTQQVKPVTQEKLVAIKNQSSAEPDKPHSVPTIPSSKQNITQRDWWQAFNDPVLDKLIDTARKQNLDLLTAQQRILETRAYLDRADAEQLPEISASADTVRRSDEAGWREGNVSTRNTRIYQAGFDATWEIDLFGGKRRESEARTAEMQATMAERDDVELSLLAEVARTYIEYRLAEYDLQLAIRTLAAQEKTARITEARYREGVDGRLDLERANVALANTQVRQPVAKARADAARFQLGFLLAQSPQQLNQLLANASQENNLLPVATLESVLGLPAEVITSRPDVRSAERQLAAATARQGVAVAARYPRLSLVGLLGLDADNGDRLSSGSSKVWSLDANLLLPLIDFGRRRADIAAADAQQAQALLGYERSVRNALADIDTTLNNYVRENEKLATYKQATESARNAWTIAVRQYREGILPQLDVLLAQRTLFDAELNEAQSSAELAGYFIALNKALGRGLAQQDG